MRAKLFAIAPSYLGDLMILAGAGVLVYGVHQVYPPAAWIVAGIILVTVGGRIAGVNLWRSA